ncbi:MAG: transposase [Heteroscytonema crispum UTEX LB 1556]
MAGITHIEIQESTNELEALLRQQDNARLKQRVQVLYMIKTQKISVSAIAKILGKHRGTVQRWLADYREGGMDRMLEFGVSPGRTRVIPNWAVESLNKQLAEPEIGFPGYKQIQSRLATVLGVEAEYATVHHLVRYRLKAKLKVARPRNCKQNTQKLEDFKKNSATIYN